MAAPSGEDRQTLVYGIVGVPPTIDPHDQVLATDYAVRITHDALLVPGRGEELMVRWMERHFKDPQVSIPRGGKPFIAVMGRPDCREVPDLEDARAFLFDGQAGCSLHIGTWYEFPFPLVDETQLVVGLRKEASTGPLADAVIEGQGRSDDLDQKDIVQRIGIVLEARLCT